MLLVAFLILVFLAPTYASTPSGSALEADSTVSALSHLMANVCGCLGLAVSWLALVPLLRLLSLSGLAEAFTWRLLSGTIAGACWVALFTSRLTLASAHAWLAPLLIGIGLPSLYRFVAAAL